MHTPYPAIRETFATMRREQQARHRDIADKLGLSEGELIAAHVGLPPDNADSPLQATRLAAQWPDIIESLEPLGEVMALTRNVSCVHEKVGTYRKASHNGPVGLVLGSEIDLRVFYAQWAHGFAVTEQTDRGEHKSLQFYDAAGTAIHKIFLKPQSDQAAYASLVRRFTHASQETGIQSMPPRPAPAEQADTAIDIAGFRQAWRNMRDTHDFFGLLKQFGVTRTQGLRLADPQFAQPVAPARTRQLIEAAAQEGVSIMVFVGNPGMIQIHTGPVHQVAVMGPWLNILDPGFSMHLREDHIASAWVVKKPTEDGLVTSLELFDQAGETIAMFFGERKPGKPELATWRALIDTLTQESTPCAA